MIKLIKKPKSKAELFVESSDPSQLRAQRVWRFVVVIWLTWLFFACFLFFRGYSPATQICLVESIVIFVLILACKKLDDFRSIMNMHLAVSSIGLLAVSLSDQAMAPTMLFYPVAILVSSQLFGVRAALSWFVINLLGFFAYSLNAHGLHGLINSSKFDELVLVIGVAGCIYFCCQQGEEYYRQRTTSLIELSQNLKTESDRLLELANTDSLTGLTNRFRFHLSLKEAVESAKADVRKFALFMIDMDGFKEINDTLGHPVGDEALIEIGGRLQTEFGRCATVARLGGDEFCIIYPNIQDRSAADLIAQIVCNVLTKRYQLAKEDFQLGTSVGYALFPTDATSDMDLLAFADTAMFHAKENQLGFASYERE
ncbi:MAG: GGDEF domain-containing protein, partial [Aureliella sp.]